MIIKNPTDKDVSISIKGVEHTVKAMEQTEKSAEIASAWVKIHQFLQVSESSAPVVKDTPTVSTVSTKAPEKKEEKKVEKKEESKKDSSKSKTSN